MDDTAPDHADMPLKLASRAALTTPEWAERVGKNLRDRRVAGRLSQPDLAALSDVSVATLQRLEAGNTGVAVGSLIQVVRALGAQDWLNSLGPEAESEPSAGIPVRVWGHTVGEVAHDRATGGYRFAYDAEWRSRGVELAPLLMPTDGPRSRTWAGLPPFLAESLPTGFAGRLLGQVSGTRGRLGQLEWIADRGMGAIGYGAAEPVAAGTTPEQVSITALVSTILDTTRRVALDDVERAELAAVAIAGGAHPKVALYTDDDFSDFRAGPHAGLDPWLVKLDGVDPASPPSRVEAAYYLMAIEAGLSMTKCALIGVDGQAHFATRRFDRTETGHQKRHVASFAALAGIDPDETFDYGAVFQVAAHLGLGVAARTELFRRVVFNIAGHVTDDHADNLAFMLDPTSLAAGWALAPAFDLAWSEPHAHVGSVEGEAVEVDRAALLRFADRYEVPGAAGVIDQVVDAVAAGWSKYAGQTQVVSALRKRIASDINAATKRLR